MISLTKKDLAVLYELEKNARMSLHDIGKNCKLSKQLVAYMLKKYEKEKIILNYTAIVDSSCLGYQTYRVYFKLRNLGSHEVFIKLLTSISETTIVNELEGSWDIGLTVAVKNIYLFYEVWNKLMHHKNMILDYKIAIYSPIYHFTRTFIAPQPQKEIPGIHVLGRSQPIEHTEKDIQLLKLLAKNSRMSAVEIAQHIGSNAIYVAKRIKYLKNNGVIRCFRPLFDWNKLGYEYYKIDLTLNSFEEGKKLFDFCHLHPNIIQIDKTIGGSDFEFEIFVRNRTEFRALLEKMMKDFPTIDHFTYFTVTRPRKETFMAF